MMKRASIFFGLALSLSLGFCFAGEDAKAAPTTAAAPAASIDGNSGAVKQNEISVGTQDQKSAKGSECCAKHGAKKSSGEHASMGADCPKNAKCPRMQDCPKHDQCMKHKEGAEKEGSEKAPAEAK